MLKFMNIMEFDLKLVHIAQNGLTIKQDEAIWLRIISKTLPDPNMYSLMKETQILGKVTEYARPLPSTCQLSFFSKQVSVKGDIMSSSMALLR